MAKSFLDQARDLLTSAYTRGSSFIAKNPTPIGYLQKQVPAINQNIQRLRNIDIASTVAGGAAKNYIDTRNLPAYSPKRIVAQSFPAIGAVQNILSPKPTFFSEQIQRAVPGRLGQGLGLAGEIALPGFGGEFSTARGIRGIAQSALKSAPIGAAYGLSQAQTAGDIPQSLLTGALFAGTLGGVSKGIGQKNQFSDSLKDITFKHPNGKVETIKSLSRNDATRVMNELRGLGAKVTDIKSYTAPKGYKAGIVGKSDVTKGRLGSEKQPWQMTQKEWESAFDAIRSNASGTGGAGAYEGRIGKSTKGAEKAFQDFIDKHTFLTMGLKDRNIEGMQLPTRHRQVVEEAISRGYDVPESVLKDYPDLLNNKQIQDYYAGSMGGNTLKNKEIKSSVVQGRLSDVYHASPIQGIKKLRASVDGVMGPGVYLHENDATARYASAMQGDGNIADIGSYKVKINTDKIFQAKGSYPSLEEVAKIKKQGFDGIRTPDGEIIIFDPNKIEIKGFNVAQPPVSDVPQGSMGIVGNKPLPEPPKPPTTPPIKGKPYIKEIQRLQDTKKVFDAGEMEPSEAKLFAKQWNDAVNIGALKENKVFAPPPGQSNPPTDPIQKLISALTEAKPLRGKQEALYREARAKQAGALSGIQGQAGGEQGFYKELGQLKGPLPKVEYENIRKNFTQTELDTLFNRVKENDVLTPFEKVNAQGALMKMLGQEGGAVPTKSELSLLSEIFPPELTKALLEKRPLIQKLMQEASDVLSLPRAFMATADFSAPFRQGVFLGPTHPKEFGSAFGSMFKYAFNPKAYEGFQASLKTRPNAKLYREFGLALSDTGSELSKREESFMSTIPEKIPLFKSIYKSSNRAYSGFLNKLRVDVFDNMVDSVRKNGQDSPEVIKDIAKFVNSATGRGDLGALSKHAEILNATMFAPRLVASRVNLLNPLYYAGLNPTVRKEALKSLVGFVGTGATVLGLAKLADAEVGTDPRSADFGKIKIGNTRLDIWGGFQQYIKLVAQLTSGQLVNSETGKVMTLGEGYNAATRKDIIIRFLESKESPIIGLVTALVTGQNNMGKPLNVPSEVISRFIPLIAQDIYDLYVDKGPKGVALAIPGMFGIGSGTYGKKELAQGVDQLGRPTSQIRPVQDLPTVLSNKLFGEQPLGSSGTTDASIYYKQLQSMPREQAAKQFDTIATSNPELAKKLVKIIKDEQKGLTVQDQVVKAKGVASGDRAISIAKEFKRLKTKQEKAKLWEHYVKTGVITKEVASQLATLLKEAK